MDDRRIIALRTRELELRATIMKKAERASEMASEVSGLLGEMAGALRVVADGNPETSPEGVNVPEARTLTDVLLNLGNDVARLQIELRETRRRRQEVGG